MPVRDQRLLNENNHAQQAQFGKGSATASTHADKLKAEMHDTEAKYHAIKAARQQRYKAETKDVGAEGCPLGTSCDVYGNDTSKPTIIAGYTSSPEAKSLASKTSSTGTCDPEHCHQYSAEYCRRLEDSGNRGHHGEPRASMETQLLDTCRVNFQCEGGQCFDGNDLVTEGSRRLGNCFLSPCADRPLTCDLQGHDFHDSALTDCSGFIKKHQFRRAE